MALLWGKVDKVMSLKNAKQRAHQQTAKQKAANENEERERLILQKYCAELAHIPIITVEREQELGVELVAIREYLESPKAQKAKRKREKFLERKHEIVNELVTGNLRYIFAAVNSYVNRGLPYLDMLQEGNLALLRAAELFEPNRKRLTTFAKQGINGRISRYCNESRDIIHVPNHIAQVLAKFKHAAAILYYKNGVKPEFHEIVKLAGVTKQDAKNAQVALHTAPLSIHSSLFEEDTAGSEDHWSFLQDKRVNLVKEAYDSQREIALRKSLRALKSRQRKVIIKRYGLFGTPQMKLREIGEELGISRQAVEQNEKKALLILSHPKRRKELLPFVEEIEPTDYS